MAWKCVYVERSDLIQVALRRFVFSSDEKGRCSLPRGYHEARSPLGITSAKRDSRGYTIPPEKPRLDDPRWPLRCSCGYEFVSGDQYQIFVEELYVDPATGLHNTLAEAPAGWMWDGWWTSRKHADGKYLIIKLPNGKEWHIDGKANNCSEDHSDPNHSCWVRTGPPSELTVNPSIDTPGYHGWLHNGVLSDGI